MSYIEIRNLVKKFDDTEVLHSLDLNIEEGSLATLLGPSGCGKSTLLRAVAGLHDIDDGEIWIDGKQIDNLPSGERDIGMVFQHYALFPNMTVEANVKFVLEMQKIDKEIQISEARRMIKLVGLDGREESYPRELSGGQQQRVALARSLVTRPKVLLLDEPLSALDAQIRINLRNLIKDIQSELGITIILVTHDQEEAMTMSEYIFVMDSGNIVQEGEPKSIYRDPENEFVTRFIGDYNVLSSEQLKNIGANDNLEFKYVAIRPETLSLESIENSYSYDGEVERVSMLGSIVRFYIRIKGDEVLTIDQLNRSRNYLDVGEKVKLYVPKDEIIKINN